jgi:hypothetical protein
MLHIGVGLDRIVGEMNRTPYKAFLENVKDWYFY